MEIITKGNKYQAFNLALFLCAKVKHARINVFSAVFCLYHCNSVSKMMFLCASLGIKDKKPDLDTASGWNRMKLTFLQANP